MLEKEIEAKFNKAVKKAGGLSFKFISTVSGVPDRIVIKDRQVFFVELKTATGKLSARQKLVFAELEEHGFPVTVVRSVEDIEAFIK